MNLVHGSSVKNQTQHRQSTRGEESPCRGDKGKPSCLLSEVDDISQNNLIRNEERGPHLSTGLDSVSLRERQPSNLELESLGPSLFPPATSKWVYCSST